MNTEAYVQTLIDHVFSPERRSHTTTEWFDAPVDEDAIGTTRFIDGHLWCVIESTCGPLLLALDSMETQWCRVNTYGLAARIPEYVAMARQYVIDKLQRKMMRQLHHEYSLIMDYGQHVPYPVVDASGVQITLFEGDDHRLMIIDERAEKLIAVNTQTGVARQADLFAYRDVLVHVDVLPNACVCA